MPIVVVFVVIIAKLTSKCATKNHAQEHEKKTTLALKFLFGDPVTSKY